MTWNQGIKESGASAMKLANVLETLQNGKAVFSRLCESANTFCFCFFYMIYRYDVSGVPADRIQRILEHDWLHLVHDLEILDSPNYLREKGKAVIALWGKKSLSILVFIGTSQTNLKGFGFDNSGHTPALVRAITQYFRNTTPGGVYIMGGAPAHWRTAESDADRNPEFLDVWLSEFDAISPWTVGRYRTERDADNFAEKKMKGDSALIKSRNEEGTIRKIDYIPVVLPGGSVSFVFAFDFHLELTFIL